VEDTLHAPAGQERASRTMRQLVLDLVEEVYEPYYDEIESRLQALFDAQLGPLERLGWALQRLEFQRQLRLSLTEAPPDGRLTEPLSFYQFTKGALAHNQAGL
jgi:hypothetical protein